MATPLVVPNGALVKIFWANGSRQWQNVYGMSMLATPPTFNQALADNLSTDFGASLTASAILPLLATTTLYVKVSVKDVRSANQPEFQSAVANTPGTGAGDVLPLSLASVVTMRTALSGRSFRGRSYFAGFTEAQNDASGRVAAAVNTACVQLLQQFNSRINSRGLTIGVMSRPAAAVTIPARTINGRAGQVNAVNLFLARDTRWESQRRRTGRT